MKICRIIGMKRWSKSIISYMKKQLKLASPKLSSIADTNSTFLISLTWDGQPKLNKNHRNWQVCTKILWVKAIILEEKLKHILIVTGIWKNDKITWKLHQLEKQIMKLTFKPVKGNLVNKKKLLLSLDTVWILKVLHNQNSTIASVNNPTATTKSTKWKTTLKTTMKKKNKNNNLKTCFTIDNSWKLIRIIKNLK